MIFSFWFFVSVDPTDRSFGAKKIIKKVWDDENKTSTSVFRSGNF